jgi:putative flippase GtrA
VKLVAQIKELAKFSLAGWAAILTDYGVYNGLLLFLPHAAAKALSFTAGGVVAYLINKYWTFGRKQRSFYEILKFAIVNGAGLGLNVGINQLVLSWTGSKNLGFVAAVAIAGTAIYLAQKLWVFRPPGGPESDDVELTDGDPSPRGGRDRGKEGAS